MLEVILASFWNHCWIALLTNRDRFYFFMLQPCLNHVAITLALFIDTFFQQRTENKDDESLKSIRKLSIGNHYLQKLDYSIAPRIPPGKSWYVAFFYSCDRVFSVLWSLRDDLSIIFNWFPDWFFRIYLSLTLHRFLFDFTCFRKIDGDLIFTCWRI